MVQGQSIYALYNVTQKTIAAEYYGLGDEDLVVVEKTSKQIKRSEVDELFTQRFTLPPKEHHLRTMFSYGGETSPYSRWEHPYFAALKDLKEIVLKFNNQQPSKFYDAYTVSEARIHYWTHKRIWGIRELARKVPEFRKAFRPWLKGVQVLVVYFINEPKEGWVNDGTITSYYVNGPTDQIIVKRTNDKEESRFNESRLKKYFPETSEKPFLGSRSSILHYLEDKVGV